MTERRWETRGLAVVAMALSMIGVIAVYGASSLLTTRGGIVGSSYALNQAGGLVVGGVLATVLARLDYHLWQRWAWPLLGTVVVLLLIPLLPFTHGIAPVRNGARRWVDFGVVQFQPSELAKLVLVLWTAMLAAKKGEAMRSFRRGVLPVLVVVAPLVAMIFFEPNLSMALLITLLTGVVVFAAGAKIGHFLLLGVGAAPLVFGAVATAQYRLARVLTFLNSGSAPTEAAWQVHQSLVGIGAGGLHGVGPGHGTQKLGYLPYAYSDFIFSTLGEEWGFLGVVVLLIGFGVFIWLGFRIARSARDPFGQLLAGGLTALVGIAVVLHIGVNLAVLPATGVTLPFVSYGRSSLLVSLIATGLLVSIGHGRGASTASGPAPAGRPSRRSRASRRS
jgi:cell division protein FtsW